MIGDQIGGSPARRFGAAHLLAFLIPAALLAGAWGSQLLGGLYPCEMCHWQRWPHYAALVIAGLAFLVRARGLRIALVVLAALAIALSGAIGVAHAGVEYGWWKGFTACTSTIDFTGLDPSQRLDAIMKAPLIRCDRPPWTLGGVSLAGFNALFSLGGAITILALVRRAR
jgi:disulfide bond formation protein DsbB